MAIQVFNRLRYPDGEPIRAKVEVRLIAGPTGKEPGYLPDDEISVLGRWASQTGSDGYWGVELEPNADFEPAGTYYEVIERYPPGNQNTKYYIRVVDGATPLTWVGDLLVASPEALLSTIPAEQVSFVPGGTILSTNVQDALIELSQQIVTGNGDAHYVHTQSVAATTWLVTHNLGKYPSVTILDTADNEIGAVVRHIDENSTEITFSPVGISGKATFN